jgi:putative ABC transport system permease protein
VPHGDRRYITPGYLEALSVPLKLGRYFNDQDREGAESVVLIDENLSVQYWPGENPVGKRIRVNGTSYTIAGVVGHVIHANFGGDSSKGAYYFNRFQRPFPLGSIVVKTRGNPAVAAAAIRDAVRAANPNQAVHTFLPMENYVSRALDTRRFGMRLLAFFALVALFLAAIGLYGVISYSVAQRRSEMGVRMALGAEPMDVLRLVVGSGMRLSIVGAAVGVAAAFAGTRYLQSQLFQVSAIDPLTILATTALLLTVALLASFLPARRAMRVDPATSLRPE